MTRKIIAAALAVSTALTLTACGKKTKASSKAVSVATQAVSVADSYLDGSVTYNQIKPTLDNFEIQMKYAVDGDKQTDEQRADFYIAVDVSSLSANILFDDMGKNADTYSDVLKARNSLAEDAGLEARK